DHHEYHISCVSIGSDLVACPGCLYMLHIELYIADNCTENIGYRKPHENIDISCQPVFERMLETFKYAHAKGKRAQNGQHDKFKRPDGIQAECCSLKAKVQKFIHHFFDPR